MKVLSVKQPWAWAIIHGGKDIENRDWPTGFRGELAIHASKSLPKVEYRDCAEFMKVVNGVVIPPYEDLVFGAIIGTVTVTGCTTNHPSSWFQGKYGFVLKDPRPCIPIQAKGSLGLWNFEFPEC